MEEPVLTFFLVRCKLSAQTSAHSYISEFLCVYGEPVEMLVPAYLILNLSTLLMLIVVYLNRAFCLVLKSFPDTGQGGRLHI